jgi:outer membrane protein assembly factor BamA
VRSIAFEGGSLPAPTLRSLLSTHVGEHVDLGKLARDRVALEDALVARGFYAAHVAEARVVFDADGTARVTFAIMQGPQFRTRDEAPVTRAARRAQTRRSGTRARS